jgi:hypothetical protein
LLGTETRFFFSLEEFFSLLFTILAQWENLVLVILVTTSEGFSKIELLLDEDTISGAKSFITFLWFFDRRGSLILLGRILLGRVLLGRVLLGRILLGRVLLGRILLRRILLRRILLRRILLGWVLLGWVLLRRVLLRRVLLLTKTRTELDLDSLRLTLHCS